MLLWVCSKCIRYTIMISNITATPQPLALALVALALVALVAAKVLLPLMITHHHLLVVVHLILSQPLLLL